MTIRVKQLFMQSIWNLASRTNTVNGVPMTSTTCAVCHNPVNAMAMVQVPPGQLDLTGGASSVDTTVVTSYEQLLFAHNEQTLNMGVLQDLLVPAPGPPDPVTGADDHHGAGLVGAADDGRQRGGFDGFL